MTATLPPPFAAGSDTSRAAAESIEPIVVQSRESVYRFIADAGDRGVTDEQIQTGLRMKQSSAVARRNSLMMLGRVVKTDDKRRNTSGRMATVYVSAKLRGRLPKEPGTKQKHHVAMYLTPNEFEALEAMRSAIQPKLSRSNMLRTLVRAFLDPQPCSHCGEERNPQRTIYRGVCTKGHWWVECVCEQQPTDFHVPEEPTPEVDEDAASMAFALSQVLGGGQ